MGFFSRFCFEVRSLLPATAWGPHVKLKATGDSQLNTSSNRRPFEMPDPLCAWIIIGVRFHHICYSGWNLYFSQCFNFFIIVFFPQVLSSSLLSHVEMIEICKRECMLQRKMRMWPQDLSREWSSSGKFTLCKKNIHHNV